MMGVIAGAKRQDSAGVHAMSSGSVPFGVPSAPSVIFSILCSALFSSASQCFFKASPRA